MEGDTEYLSSRPWFDEYREWMCKRGNDESVLSCLYPSLPDDYFEKHPDAVLGKKKKEKPSVRPFVGRIDLNNDQNLDEDNKPKNAWEIGFKFDF